MFRKTILIVIFISCSSPYFNTFYNAEKYFDAGELQYFKEVSQWREKDNYRNQQLSKAIEKCAKLLIDFGDNEEENSYADDAYLMMIKASYYLKNFDEVIKLNDLMLVKTPSSPLLSEAQLVTGNAYLERGDAQSAKDSYQNIRTVAKNFNIIAKSRLGIAKIHLQNNEIERAIAVLESIIDSEEKSEELELTLDQEILYDVLNLTIQTLDNIDQHKKLVELSDGWKRLEDPSRKELIVLKILPVFTEYTEKEDFKKFKDEVLNDQDFSINLQIVKLFEIYDLFLSDKLDEYDLKYSELNKQNNYKYKLELNSLHIQKVNLNPLLKDSLLKTYNIQLNLVKNVNKRKKISKKIEELSFFIRTAKQKKVNEEKIESLKLSLDTLSKSDNSYSSTTKNLLSHKEALNSVNFELGEYYFNETKLDKAYKHFLLYSKNGNDSSKLAVSYLYMASIREGHQDLKKAKELYSYVLDNFSEYKRNEELYKKLGRKLPGDKNKIIYENLLNAYEPDSLIYTDFYSGYKAVINQIDTSSVYYEKLKFVNIMYSIRFNDNNSFTIALIDSFRKDHSKSIYLKEINKYPTKALINIKKEEKNESEEELSEEKAGNIRAIKGIKNVYNGEFNGEVAVELGISSDGKVTAFNILDKEYLEYKMTITLVINELQFNKSNEKIRKYTINLKFSNGENLPKTKKKEKNKRIILDE